MIADKLISCFYLVEAEGDAINGIIPGDFSIQKIAISSKDFSNDLEADSALTSVINVLKHQCKDGNIKQDTHINPEFFPMIEGKKLSPEESLEMEQTLEMAENASRELMSKNQVAIAITKVFDPIGDYVVIRKNLSAENFNVIGRVVANMDEYVMFKSIDQFALLSDERLPSNVKSLVIH